MGAVVDVILTIIGACSFLFIVVSVLVIVIGTLDR